MSLLGCRVLRAPEVKWEGQVIISPNLFHTKQLNSWLNPEKVASLIVCQENGRLGQVGTVVALGPPECPVGACKVTVVCDALRC